MSKSTRRLFAWLSLVPASMPVLAQPTLGIGPLEPAGGYRERPGVPITFICPASDGAKARLHGTDTYTDDSPICAAAIHAGVLDAGKAGAVTIVTGNSPRSFEGSERNGITSLSYERWTYWYSFLREDRPGEITWSTAWKYVPEEFTEPVQLVCPAGKPEAGPVYGTDVYATESRLCGTAVHAGIITPGEGGRITVVRAPGPGAFTGSERNGVTSRNAGGSSDAFSVASSAVAGLPAERTPGGTLVSNQGPSTRGAPGGSSPPPAEPPPDPSPDPGPGPTGPVAPETDPNCTTAAGGAAVCITVAGWSGEGAGYSAPPPIDESDPLQDTGPSPPLTIVIAGWNGQGSGHVAPLPPAEDDPAQSNTPPPPLTIAIAGWSGEGQGYVEETNDDEEDPQ